MKELTSNLSIKDYLSLLPEYCGECKYYLGSQCYRFPLKVTEIRDNNRHIKEIHKEVSPVDPVRIACGEGLQKYRDIDLNEIVRVIRKNNFISNKDLLDMKGSDRNGKEWYEVKVDYVIAPLCSIQVIPVPDSVLLTDILIQGNHVPLVSTREAKDDVELIVMMIIAYLRAVGNYSFKERADIKCLINNSPIIAGLCDVKHEQDGIRIQFLDK